MKYNTLAELVDAFKSGEIKPFNLGLNGEDDDSFDEGGILWLDNDTTFVYVNDERVFRMPPDDLLTQALTLLGVPCEYV